MTDNHVTHVCFVVNFLPDSAAVWCRLPESDSLVPKGSVRRSSDGMITCLTCLDLKDSPIHVGIRT